jgi:thermitase
MRDLKTFFTFVILLSALTYPSYSSCKLPKKIIKIAVVDTGYNAGPDSKVKLCRTGHKDFTGTGLDDHHKYYHGTEIANTIADRINKNVNYCIVILKWYDDRVPESLRNSTNEDIFNYAATLGVDVVNYSAGGEPSSEPEKQSIERLLKRKIKVLVAAGNEAQNLDIKCNYFPACYRLPGLIVVGNINSEGYVVKSSNYGKAVTHWEMGVDIAAYNGKEMRLSTGTSQSTAIRTAKEVNRMRK